MIFVLKLINNMELIDTPNPNAKKILTDLSESIIAKDLEQVDGVSSIFYGPGFITVSKENSHSWESITEDIINIFDKL
tara:strand:- start:354 stop:587 length:234 start_codon:yes stop_codon:yes gene_type:complete